MLTSQGRRFISKRVLRTPNRLSNVLASPTEFARGNAGRLSKAMQANDWRGRGKNRGNRKIRKNIFTLRNADCLRQCLQTANKDRDHRCAFFEPGMVAMPHSNLSADAAVAAYPRLNVATPDIALSFVSPGSRDVTETRKSDSKRRKMHDFEQAKKERGHGGSDLACGASALVVNGLVACLAMDILREGMLGIILWCGGACIVQPAAEENHTESASVHRSALLALRSLLLRPGATSLLQSQLQVSLVLRIGKHYLFLVILTAGPVVIVVFIVLVFESILVIEVIKTLLKLQRLAREPVDGSWDEFFLDVLAELIVQLELALDVVIQVIVILIRLWRFGGVEKVKERRGRHGLLDDTSLLRIWATMSALAVLGWDGLDLLLLRCFLLSTFTVRFLPSFHWISTPSAWS